MITKKIRTYLDNLTLNDVYVGEPPEDTLLPYVIVDQLSGGEQADHEGTNYMNDVIIDVTSWAFTTPEARTLSESMKGLLHYRSDGIRLITLENEQDVTSGAKKGVALAFAIRYIREV